MTPSKHNNITIKDLARELNVSPSTVSRALSDSPLVKPETRAAIKKLAEKYNYEPNYNALSLRINKTKMIGVIIPQLVHDFFSQVLRGIEDYSYSRGYNVIICPSREDYEREVTDARTLLAGKVDGLLVCVSKETSSIDHLTEFVDRGIPIVCFDRAPNIPNTSKVIIDDFQAAYDATRHLVQQQCVRIAYIGGPKQLQIFRDRYEGFREALADSSLPESAELVVHCDSEYYEDNLETTAKLMDNDFDGVFAATDMMAIAAIKNLKKKGMKVPEDVALVGFSNWSITSIYEPSISTVDQRGYEMGSRAAELLIDEISNGRSMEVEEVLPARLVLRESSKRT